MDGFGWIPDKLEHESSSEIVSGRKYDGGKPKYGLLPPNGIKEVVEILTYGAEKYDPGNWMLVPQFDFRYTNAMQRHFSEWRMGNKLDDETGKHHLAHAICCLLFLLERDIMSESEWRDYVKRELAFCGHPSVK